MECEILEKVSLTRGLMSREWKEESEGSAQPLGALDKRGHECSDSKAECGVYV
jgi:hypothetical protein